MSMLQALKGIMMPQSKMVSKAAVKAADVHKDIVAVKASASDIIANQNRAMLQSGKKAYVKPEMNKVELKEAKMTACSGSIDEDILGGSDDFDDLGGGGSIFGGGSSAFSSEW